jgi:hypothetical protein
MATHSIDVKRDGETITYTVEAKDKTEAQKLVARAEKRYAERAARETGVAAEASAE